MYEEVEEEEEAIGRIAQRIQVGITIKVKFWKCLVVGSW